MARKKPEKTPNRATRSTKSKKPQATDTVFQFKITLRGARPPIWRRIQVRDCTLDELHEYIQTAMGWSNSHLHHFHIGKQFYGDPDRPPAEADRQYPVCLQGKGASPPEDVGGVWGYPNFLEALRNPAHEEHEEMLEWAGGEFDPKEFDPAHATEQMREGLPDWRRMR